MNYPIPDDVRPQMERASVAALMTSKRFTMKLFATAVAQHSDDELRQLATAMTVLMTHLSEPADLPTPTV